MQSCVFSPRLVSLLNLNCLLIKRIICLNAPEFLFLLIVIVIKLRYTRAFAANDANSLTTDQICRGLGSRSSFKTQQTSPALPSPQDRFTTVPIIFLTGKDFEVLIIFSLRKYIISFHLKVQIRFCDHLLLVYHQLGRCCFRLQLFYY